MQELHLCCDAYVARWLSLCSQQLTAWLPLSETKGSFAYVERLEKPDLCIT